MVRRKPRKKLLKKVREYINKGYSANRIQKELRKEKLGIRRKALLVEIRRIKQYDLTYKEKQKYVPKKYRKPEERVRIKKPVIIYRIAYIIPSLPVHSKPFKRNYLGFRIVAFSKSKSKLRRERAYLRRKLVEEASKYVKGDIMNWENWDIEINKSYITEVVVPENYAESWIFAVEKEGKEQYSRSGVI